jgi:undecaprenyl diphosphate synthase
VGGAREQSSQTYRVHALLQSVHAAQAAGIRYFTLSTFGPIGAVKRNLALQSGLANLLLELIAEGQAELARASVRVTTIGNVDELPSRLRHALEGLCYATRSGTALNLTLAVAYTGRRDIVEATRYLAAAIRAGQVLPEEIDEQLFMSQLITHALPRVDLALFTASSACSDFLPFESAHAAKISLGVSLTQFRPRHLNAALAQYARSQARQVREA